jgi:acetolactate decarboxylase
VQTTMVKKLIFLVFTVILLVTLLAGCSPAIRGDRDTIYQVSTISALMQGVFNGEVTVGQLRTYGDVGVGTFQDLNGEMIVLDGKVYRARLDGSMETVPDDTRVPFAEVTFFDNDRIYTIDKPQDINGLQAYIDSVLPTLNVFYAIKVEGKFSYVKTRSVPIQQKPYVTLAEAVKGQQVSEFKDVEGTMIGFRCPPYVEGVNVPGYHFHFINKERTRGGHVLDIKIASVKAIVDDTANLIMQLPDNSEFIKARLGGGAPEGLKQVEQGK